MKDNQSEIAPIIDVIHEFAGGWHTFTSPQIPGLYIVTSKENLEDAYTDIPVAIEMLIEADTGKAVEVLMRPEYQEYRATLPAHMCPDVRHYEVRQAA